MLHDYCFHTLLSRKDAHHQCMSGRMRLVLYVRASIMARYSGRPVKAPPPMQGLWDVVRKKAYRKRTSGRVRLVLGPGVELAVALYTLLHAAAKGSTVLLHAESNEELRSENALICMDTGALAGHRPPRGQGPGGGWEWQWRCTCCCMRPPRA